VCAQLRRTVLLQKDSDSPIHTRSSAIFSPRQSRSHSPISAGGFAFNLYSKPQQTLPADTGNCIGSGAETHTYIHTHTHTHINTHTLTPTGAILQAERLELGDYRGKDACAIRRHLVYYEAFLLNNGRSCEACLSQFGPRVPQTRRQRHEHARRNASGKTRKRCSGSTRQPRTQGTKH